MRRNEGIGYHKGYDVYMGFTKWKIGKKGVEHPLRFDTYKKATDYIDENLVRKSIDILKWLSHADTVDNVEIKKIFLTQVGHKQIEQGVILSTSFYVSYGNSLLLVPFCFLKYGRVIKKGVNLYNFLADHELTEVKEIFRKDVTILNGKVTKNKIIAYDCSKIDWEKLLNMKLVQAVMKEDKSLDN